MRDIHYSLEDLSLLRIYISESTEDTITFLSALPEEEVAEEIDKLWHYLRVEQLLPRQMPLEAKDSPTPVLAIKWLRENLPEESSTEEEDDNYEDDYDGEPLRFNEDGECIGDSTWDYPGSPYLDEDDDIY